MNVDDPKARAARLRSWLVATEQVVAACETAWDDGLIVRVGDEDRGALPWFVISRADGTRIGLVEVGARPTMPWLGQSADGRWNNDANTCGEIVAKLMAYEQAARARAKGA